MECNKSITWSNVVQKCKVCRMDLCKKCARKHDGACVWCYQHAPDQYVKMKKATSIAMLFMPAFILFMPAPMPAVLLVATNPSIIFSMIIYGVAAYIILGIMRGKATKNIIALIPANVESLDERKTTVAGAQTQTLISHLATGSREPPQDLPTERTLQAPDAVPAPSDELHSFDIASEVQTQAQDLSPVEPSASQVEEEETITCRNCENVFKRSPGVKFCPACGFIYRD